MRHVTGRKRNEVEIRQEALGIPSMHQSVAYVFQYIPFTDQIARVSVHITRWHPSLASTSAQCETHFYDAINKCSETDLSASYGSFISDLRSGCGELRTYAQLLHQKDVVARALIRHLNDVDSASLVTLLQ
ncbi:unnamed protein product [Gongylonema pulchrum]|uniref:Uncharacterized protein n=1 Tax=Gongylonema pulchrum TaxID=637853 RepID=A0A3P7PF13_9BILA|nr:unnamed protein product [Gongylonema pulchrum]